MEYKTILADPPWPYKQKLGRGKSEGDTTRGGLPYRIMTIDEIGSLPVGEIVDDNSMLFLWTTNSHIREALHIVQEWGFEYKTMITWAKEHFGLGYWFRGQTEHLLFGVKGNPRSKMSGPHGTTGKSWSTLITARKSKHSEKPPQFYEMIEDVSEPPRLELFARDRREGWDAWGDELPDTIQQKIG